MKDKLPPDQLASLTREYHRTYGALGAVSGNYQKASLISYYLR